MCLFVPFYFLLQWVVLVVLMDVMVVVVVVVLVVIVKLVLNIKPPTITYTTSQKKYITLQLNTLKLDGVGPVDNRPSND